MTREVNVIVECSLCNGDHYMVRTATELSDEQIRHPSGKAILKDEAWAIHVLATHAESVMSGLDTLLRSRSKRGPW